MVQGGDINLRNRLHVIYFPIFIFLCPTWSENSVPLVFALRTHVQDYTLETCRRLNWFKAPRSLKSAILKRHMLEGQDLEKRVGIVFIPALVFRRRKPLAT